MKFKLIAIDLDGTLLDSTKNVSQETVAVVREVLGGGGHVVLSSARPPRTTVPFYDQLGLNSPMVNYNGAFVWSPATGDVLLHHPVSCNDARIVTAWARQRYPGIRVSGEIRDKWYTDFYDGTYQTETAKLYQPDLVAPIEKWLTGSVTKLLLLGKSDWLDDVQQFIARELAGRVRALRAESKLLQIMSRLASKLGALKLVAKRLGVPRREVMAIGDNLNDVGMLEWAGVGVSMANGALECLRVADHVTDHNDDNGVANVIRELVIEGKQPHGR